MRQFLPILVILASTGGCTRLEDVARTRAANDFKCGSVEVWSIGGTSFQAHGCGQRAVYDCSASGSVRGTTSDYVCVPEGNGAGGESP